MFQKIPQVRKIDTRILLIVKITEWTNCLKKKNFNINNPTWLHSVNLYNEPVTKQWFLGLGIRTRVQKFLCSWHSVTGDAGTSPASAVQVPAESLKPTFVDVPLCTPASSQRVHIENKFLSVKPLVSSQVIFDGSRERSKSSASEDSGFETSCATDRRKGEMVEQHEAEPNFRVKPAEKEEVTYRESLWLLRSHSHCTPRSSSQIFLCAAKQTDAKTLMDLPSWGQRHNNWRTKTAFSPLKSYSINYNTSLDEGRSSG